MVAHILVACGGAGAGVGVGHAERWFGRGLVVLRRGLRTISLQRRRGRVDGDGRSRRQATRRLQDVGDGARLVLGLGVGAGVGERWRWLRAS
jgi:hypothetical protein